MPNWKKVIVSGSNAVLNNITASGHMSVLDGGLTVNNAASTELEVVGDISASGTITCDTIVASNLDFADDFSYTDLSVEKEITTTHSNTNEHSAHLLKLKNTSDTVETFAGISFDVGSEDDADSIAAAIRAVNASSNSTIHGAHLVFSTNNAGDDGCTERMRITSGGFIGMGDFDTVAQPLQNLHIKGNSAQMIFEENTTDYLRIGTGMTDKDSFIGYDDTNMLHIGTFASISDTTINTKLLINQTGLVGIGDDVLDPPINRLHIRHSGADGDNGIMITNKADNVFESSLLGGIGFDSEDGGTQSSIKEAAAYIAGYAGQPHTVNERGGYLVLGTKQNNDNVNVESRERLRIDSLGRIGINCTASFNKLQINHTGQNGDNGILLVNDTSNIAVNNMLGGIGFDSIDGNVPSSVLEGSAYIAAYASEDHSVSDKGGYLSFGTAPTNQDDDTTSIERMRINANGTIDIYEDFNLYDEFSLYDGSGGDRVVRMYDSGDDGVIDVYANNSVTTRIFGNGYSYFNGGNVGIGDSSPLSKLHVQIAQDNDSSPTDLYSEFCLTLRNESNVVNAFTGIAFDTSTETDSDSIGAAIKAINANVNNYFHDSHLTFHTNNTADDTLYERMRIQNDGKIIIGNRVPNIVSPPNAQLFISGANNNIVLAAHAGERAAFHFSGASTSGYTTVFHMDDTGLDIGHGSAARALNLKTGNADRLTIAGGGAVGIGTTSPSANRLHVFASSINSNGLVKFESSESSIDSADRLLVLDFSGDSTITTNNDFIQFQDGGGEVGRIHSEVSYGTFTGAHVSQRPSGSSFSDWKTGMIVKSTGNIIATGSTIGLAWPEVDLTTTQKDKAVMGVWHENNPPGHNSKYLDHSLPMINYNALGEGMILVTDTNGNIETGDYICSSTRLGHGEKQDDDLLHNYTVAKATQPYNFDSASLDPDLGYKSVLIACTYHCG